MIDLKNFKGVAVLYNESSGLIKGEQKDLISEQGVISCAKAVADALTCEGIPAQLAPIHGEAERALAEYSPADWLVFNLAEGLGGKSYEESRIAWLLEIQGYHFTGSSGRVLSLTTNKALTKYYLARIGLTTPRWWLFHTPDDIPRDTPFPYPLFVKPVAEDASLGIENDSVVSDFSALRERTDYIINYYQQSALVEEFIPGREFNVSAWGDPPELLPLAEIDFQDISGPDELKIVNYDAKWQDDAYEFHHTPAICPAVVSPTLKRKINRSALSALKCAGVNTYARVDLRISADEEPYILEINCNPDISPGAGFANTVQCAGINYQKMVLKIISLARRPSDEYRPAHKNKRRIRH
jgi:D-alanine-D-alanine ligase